MKYVIAKYLRISDEDIDLGTDKHESSSIANQRALLDNFISDHIYKTPEFLNHACGIEVAEYLDDGWSGTNFSRPGVARLVELARTGGIQCIIVKDLSRWGRNYLEVGDFLEQKFPAWGVRFISLAEMYDSAKLNKGAASGMGMAFRGLIAQMYSQDLSEKVRSGKDAASRTGKIITGQPTYGYDKDKNDRRKFAINPYEASVVKRIYNLAEQGVRTAEIVRRLNADDIATPQASKKERGYKANWGQGDCWGKGAVGSILRDERYTGKWIYGKTRIAEVGSRKAKPVPKSEWIVIDGAIPAIIDEEQFARVCRQQTRTQQVLVLN
jgi:DNA invertase Pin-like site-specific DNA recombinase